MAFYTVLNLVILAIPLPLFFLGPLYFYRRIPRVLLKIMPVYVFFVVWDVVAVARGHWRFAGAHTVYLPGFSLPVGELLFFLVAPLACLFIRDVIELYIRARAPRAMPAAWAAIGAGLLVAGASGVGGEYTTTVCIVAALLSFALAVLPGTRFDVRVAVFFAVSFVPFVIFNAVFAGLPIVIYGEDQTLGARLLGIPIEDFAYQFALMAGLVVSDSLLVP